MTGMDDKLDVLACALQGMRRVAVAFSGGTDSTFLLACAQRTPGVEAFAITVASSLMPDADAAFAESFCTERGIPHQVLRLDPLTQEDIRANEPDRCYHCKRFIMSAVVDAARQLDAQPCDGSNADDEHDYRPGTRAVQELGIASPLAEAGLTKAEIRAAAHEVGLPNWDTPASACVASRIPYGTPLDERVLNSIQQAEAVLHAEGFAQARVRAHGDVARIEVPSDQVDRLMQESLRTRIAEALREVGFAYITADLEGYRMGSLNESIREEHHG